MALCRLSLLVILPVAVAAAGRIAAQAADERQGGSTRMGWYVRSEQWLADFRTLTAACRFVLEGDADAPGSGNPPAYQSVGKPGVEAAFHPIIGDKSRQGSIDPPRRSAAHLNEASSPGNGSATRNHKS